ncbi:alcohol dehydrogenase catalytic domain-containing protein [Jiella pacifica]|uniref:Alcohol dehydrogenase catalytic domain-containing protein n=1 Tax=Jiella pacifica TaxID=2696469 RepID=A0A6N9T845_9HYPH|nr:alcohol dehydrogenase catalytic domain-containing protein [Jiella pacifica]NDW07391.1 alcohol dehydrogenase catalytic domain-containing protein [Jiella pacifica]
MKPTEASLTNGKTDGTINRHWPHRGGSFEALMTAEPEDAPMAGPRPDEVIARVEAVSICSSDIKVVRMGPNHPLFSGTTEAVDTILGHEVCLRVHAVGANQTERFRPGQRLGLQPAIRMAGKRRIIGMDLPGGFAQYLRLGPEALADYVLDVPEHLSAAAIALLEPYGCAERAWRPNARQEWKAGGTALIVSGPDADFDLAELPDWSAVTVVGEAPAFMNGRPATRADDLAHIDGPFDDILALGDLTVAQLSRLGDMLATGGLLLQGRRSPSPGKVRLDPARVHYDHLSFLGTTERDLSTAFAPSRQRFDVSPGGVALVHGAGGAMGRIHVHRLLQHEDGPETIIASSRKGQRLSDLERDFAPLARSAGRNLVVVGNEGLAQAISEYAPDGLDDVVVVAPDPAAVADAAGWLAPDGLLAVFAGFPYGQRLEIDLAAVALTGLRLTGSTGCSVADMRDVLARVENGTLDLSANIAAVAGLDALPQALKSVADGTVSGKIVIYPQRRDLPLTPAPGWNAAKEAGLTG